MAYQHHRGIISTGNPLPACTHVRTNYSSRVWHSITNPSRLPASPSLITSVVFPIRLPTWSLYVMRLRFLQHNGCSGEKLAQCVSTCHLFTLQRTLALHQRGGKQDNCPFLSQWCIYDTWHVSPQSGPSHELTVSNDEITDCSPTERACSEMCINASVTSPRLRFRLRSRSSHSEYRIDL